MSLALKRVAKRAAIYALALPWAVTICLGQQYSFKDYIDGLGNLSVNCLLQDRAGFLWIGTESGLYQYDGSRFWQFGEKEGLPSGFVRALSLDRDGRLWVGTRDGLAFRTGQRSFSTVTYQQQNLKIPYDTTLASSPDGQVYAVTQFGVLVVKSTDKGRSWQAARLQLAGDANSVSSVLAKPDGSIVLGCGKGLCEISDGKLLKYGRSAGLPEDVWKCLLLRANGELWARGPKFIAVLEPGHQRFEIRNPAGHAAADVTYLSLAEDRAGIVLASFGSDVGRYQHGRWEIISDAKGFGKGTVSSILQDREGTVWFGLLGHGLRKWLGYGDWQQWTTRQGLESDEIWALQQDSRRRIWAANGLGLSVLEPGAASFKAWSQPDIDSPSRCLSLEKSKDGFLWAATYQGKLIRIDEATLDGRQFSLPAVSRVFVDSRDRVWASTSQGLFVSERVHERRQRRAEFRPAGAVGSGGHRIQDMAEDASGKIWAISDESLYRFDDPNWTRLDVSQAKLGHHLEDLAIDRSGGLWINATGAGVARFQLRNGNIAGFTTPHLSSNEVVFLRVDSRGWIWFGEDHGVEILDGTSLRRYTAGDGLIWDDTDARGFLEDRDGSVWIGTSGGLSHFLVPNAAPLKPPPPPIFVEVEYGTKDPLVKSELAWKHDPLTVSLASLTLRNEEAVKFRYRLVGLEDEWVETAGHTVRYPELGPGRYSFQALAIDSMSGKTSSISPVFVRDSAALVAHYAIPHCNGLRDCFSGGDDLALAGADSSRASTRTGTSGGG